MNSLTYEHEMNLLHNNIYEIYRRFALHLIKLITPMESPSTRKCLHSHVYTVGRTT